jgi:hypothetical protein
MAQVLMITGNLHGAIAMGQQALDLAAVLLRQNVDAADRESGTPSTDVQIMSQAWMGQTFSKGMTFWLREAEAALAEVVK